MPNTITEEEYTVCDGCPCSNHNDEMDYPECNLGYDIIYREIETETTSKGGLVVIEREKYEISMHCGLSVVVWIGGEYIPRTIKGKIIGGEIETLC